MRSIALAVFLMTSSAWADVTVSTTTELTSAIAAAKAGDTIVLNDGTYNATGFSCSANGTSATPITVTAKNPLGARINFDGLEGFKVSGAHWHFVSLDIHGVCANDADCEHAFHVGGGAVGFVLEKSRVVDFNAQLKVNAAQISGTWTTPDDGRVESCEVFDTHARNTGNPTTKLNIDTGDRWIVRANYIHDFQKGGGDTVSYGAFMKSGGKNGVFERNLVVCTDTGPTGGTRIGLSFGGGGTAPQFCAPAFNAGVPCDIEHTGGTMRNNIIASCSDVGIYLNRGKDSKILFNTLVQTMGIDFRFVTTTGLATGNVLDGKIRPRDLGTFTPKDNLEQVTSFGVWYTDPAHGDLHLKGDVSALLGKSAANPDVADDYCVRTRSGQWDLGALQSSLGDCVTKPPPGGAPTSDAGTTPDGSVPIGDGGDAGVTPPSNDGGCGCATTTPRSAFSPTALAIVVIALRRLRRRRGQARMG